MTLLAQSNNLKDSSVAEKNTDLQDQGNSKDQRMLNLAFFHLFQSFSHNDLLLCFWQGKIFKQFISQLQSVKLLHFRTVSSQNLRFSTVNTLT